MGDAPRTTNAIFIPNNFWGLAMSTSLTAHSSTYCNEKVRMDGATSDRREFLLLLCFSLSAVAVILFLLFAIGPDRIGLIVDCGDVLCSGM
jgi:hypothetical protein